MIVGDSAWPALPWHQELLEHSGPRHERAVRSFRQTVYFPLLHERCHRSSRARRASAPYPQDEERDDFSLGSRETFSPGDSLARRGDGQWT
jgi:hypothetical protein